MLTSLGIVILSALMLGKICDMVRLPRLVAMLVIGIVFGPYVLDILSGKLLEISSELREIALVIILTRAGLSLSMGEMRSIGKTAIYMCFLPATFEIVGYAVFAPIIMGISLVDSLLIGSIIAAVSPAVVVPRMIKLKEEGYGNAHGVPALITAASSVDDVYVIVLFSAFLTLSGGGAFDFSIIARVPISILLGIAVGVVVGICFAKFFEKFHTRDSVKVLLLLSSSFILLAVEDAISAVVPYSALLSVITIGLAISTISPVRAERLSFKFGKLWLFAEIFLFVLVGAIVDINYAVSNALPIIAVIALALIFRMLGVFVAVLGSKLSAKERLFCMLAYTPKATVQAAIGGVALSAGLAIGDTALSFAVVAILLTAPLGAIAIDSTHKILLEKSE